MKKTEKSRHLGLRIDEETLYKLHYISGSEARSTNGQILLWIRQSIAAFEKVNGKIEYPPKEEE